MTIEPRFAERILRMRGEEGRLWLEAIPTLIARAEDAWQITVAHPFPDLSYNYVAPARRADGSDAVLKIGLPGGEQQREADALRHFDGGGAISLLEQDGLTLLLERVTPGEVLATLAAADDDRATIVAADVMGRLWSASPPRGGVEIASAAERCRGIERHRHLHGGSGPIDPHLFEQARSTLADLLASPGEMTVVHGDLHHFNILSSDRDRWLAIDPKGVRGDRELEAAPLLFNPTLVPTEQLERRIDLLVEHLTLDRQRLICWGVVYGILSACWSLEDREDDWEDGVELARRMSVLA